jgi:homocysteine S-methyltransferase
VHGAGADVVNIGDSPMARVRLSALATARLIEEQVPLKTILHFTTRDRNLMGIQSDLLGAHALGLRNVLCLTGDPPGLGDYAHATAVYDLDSIGLVNVLKGFNQGHDALGQAIGTATHFDIGVGMNPNADDLDLEIERSLRKIDAGARFVMLQPIYEERILYQFLEKARLPVTIPVMLGVMPLVSYRQALYLNNEVPGIKIPQWILERMASHIDGESFGADLAIQLIDALAPVVSGVYLVPSYNRVDSLVPIIQHIRQRLPITDSDPAP